MPRNIESLTHRLNAMLELGWHWNFAGELVRRETGPMPETPWIYQNLNFQCVLWHQIFFEMATAKTMVHSHCHDCFKVVIEPRTVEELIALENWQKTLEDPCKCGIEIREFVKMKRLYGGYFYNRGQEEGQQCYEVVKSWVLATYYQQQDENTWFEKTFDEPMRVSLKRGCTEFERALGPSDLWQITEEQERLEEVIDKIVDFNPFQAGPQPETLKEGVRMTWLKWAHHHGDMTYVRFMPDKQPFDEEQMYYTAPYVTYHEEDRQWTQNWNSSAS